MDDENLSQPYMFCLMAVVLDDFTQQSVGA